MTIIEVAEMLLDKQVYVSSAIAALNILLASPMKDILKSTMDCARALLASTNSMFPQEIENEAMEFYKQMYAMNNLSAAVNAM